LASVISDSMGPLVCAGGARALASQRGSRRGTAPGRRHFGCLHLL